MGSLLSKSERKSPTSTVFDRGSQSAVLHRGPRAVPPTVVSIKDNRLHLSCGRIVYDGSGGAAVSNLGHSYSDRIGNVMKEANDIVDYVASLSYTTDWAERLCTALVDSTEGILAKALIYNSGSDAVEAAVKLAKQYFHDSGEPQRYLIIARKQSYHGATGTALALGDHKARKQIYEDLLPRNMRHVSSCFEYLQRKEGQSIAQFVDEKVQELETMFEDLGPEKVMAFVCEPIVGAALGCAPAVEGYLKRMQDVCRRHGALFILDEIMCGSGRTGKMHAFMHHAGVRPDILVMGKGLGGGWPVSAMLCSQKIADVLQARGFNHGHTFQNHPGTCAAACEVLQIIEEQRLLTNVNKQGDLLLRLMQEKLEVLPHVSPIRGQGLFLGFSLVADKATKRSFDRDLHVALSIHEKAWKDPKYGIYVYPGTGSAADGLAGDHLIVAPPFTITEKEVHWLVDRLELLIKDFFAEKGMTKEMEMIEEMDMTDEMEITEEK